MALITIYLESHHPRMEYVWDFFCTQIEGLSIRFGTSSEPIEDHCINVSPEKVGHHEIWLNVHPEFYFHPRNMNKPVPVLRNGIPILFPNESDLGFDFTMSVFWFLVRAEEYNCDIKDRHDRFYSASSIHDAFASWNIPLVDWYCDQLVEKINLTFQLQLKRKKQNQIFSIGFDIDRWFKYKHKSILRNVMGLLRDAWHGEFHKANLRWHVIKGAAPDPYDSFSQIESLPLEKDQILFFILCGGLTKFDNNEGLDRPFVIRKLEEIQPWAKIGIHPSYLANVTEHQFIQEKEKLEGVVQHTISSSRQHYIRLEIPASYQLLSKHGITEDYSMGFPDIPGFRAGTCHPFFWYDCESEKVTSLKVIPFVVMDRTLQQYCLLSPEQSMATCISLLKVIQQYEGHFHLIWHNSSFDFDDEWKGWNHFLNQLLDTVKKLQ